MEGFQALQDINRHVDRVKAATAASNDMLNCKLE